MSIEKEILVYANLPYKKYRWISYVGFIQAGFLFANILFLPSIKKIKERAEQESPSKEKSSELIEDDQFVTKKKGFLEKFKNFDVKKSFSWEETVNNLKDNRDVVLTLLVAGGLTLTAITFYAKRAVHKITLLPGDRVGIATFSPFAIGEPKVLELPLHHVSCFTTRQSKNNYSILKLKGFKGYHLVHKSEGRFYEPKLYDKYLGYKRSWK